MSLRNLPYFTQVTMRDGPAMGGNQIMELGLPKSESG